MAALSKLCVAFSAVSSLCSHQVDFSLGWLPPFFRTILILAVFLFVTVRFCSGTLRCSSKTISRFFFILFLCPSYSYQIKFTLVSTVVCYTSDPYHLGNTFFILVTSSMTLLLRESCLWSNSICITWKKNPGLSPDLQNQNLHFNKTPREIYAHHILRSIAI